MTEPSEDNNTATAITPTTSTTADSSTTTTTANTNIKISTFGMKNKLPSTTSKSTFATQEEDERAPVREIVKLDYTPEELSAMQQESGAYTQYIEDYTGDADFGGVKKSTSSVGGVGAIGGMGGVGVVGGVLPGFGAGLGEYCSRVCVECVVIVWACV